MIAIVIVGILSAIAIGSYVSYINRAELSEASIFRGSLKTVVVEYYNSEGTFGATASDFPTDYFNNFTSGVAGEYVQSVDIVYISPTVVDIDVTMKD